MSQPTYTYLALGDSYTIGEAVPLYQSFPYQAVQLLRNRGLHFHAPEIIAKTGWTTDELLEKLNSTILMPSYDIVSLLIGVNNQYRGRDVESYKMEFEALLQKAISFSKNETGGVIVLSIPDWSVTPFAERLDQKKISTEIDSFNDINQAVAASFGISYINITPFTREALSDNSLVADDKLHPSGKDYARWADRLADRITGIIAKHPM